MGEGTRLRRSPGAGPGLSPVMRFWLEFSLLRRTRESRHFLPVPYQGTLISQMAPSQGKSLPFRSFFMGFQTIG